MYGEEGACTFPAVADLALEKCCLWFNLVDPAGDSADDDSTVMTAIFGGIVPFIEFVPFDQYETNIICFR